MNYLRLLLLIVIWPICTLPVHAQLFRKKAPPPAAQRVPELVYTLKTEGDERRRTTAVEALREFDVQTYSEILPALIEAARRDASVSVRMEAITSLSKIRPVTQEAGQAIEHAASEDSNLRARVHARTTLWKYQLAGYSSKTPGLAAREGRKTDEPPLLEPPVDIPPPALPTVPVGLKKSDVPRPLPKGTAFTTAVPQRPTLVTRPAPDPTVVEEALPPLPPGIGEPPPLPPAPPVSVPPTTTPTTAPSPLPPAPPLPEIPPLPK